MNRIMPGLLTTTFLLTGCGSTAALYKGSDAATVRTNSGGITRVGDRHLKNSPDEVVVAPGVHIIGVRNGRQSARYLKLTTDAGMSYKIEVATLYTVSRASKPRVIWSVLGGGKKPVYKWCESRTRCE